MSTAASPLLIENIRVLTADAEGQHVIFLDNQSVLIVEGRFQYVGSKPPKHLEQYSDLRVYDGKDRLLLPGYANAHAHLTMTLLRNVADDLNLQDWLFNEIFPKEARLREKDVRCGSELGLYELLRSGCTASADMYMFPEVTANLALEKGFRLNFCIGAVDQIDHVLKSYTMNSFEQLYSQVKRYHGAGEGLLRTSLLVHSPYLYPEPAYAELAELANALNIPVQVHLAETKKEIEDCLSQYGKRPTHFLYEKGLLQQHTLAAHSIYLDESEQDLLKKMPVYLVHNPASNMKLASGIMPAQAYLEAGLKLALGSDGPSSNNKLDFSSDLRLAALLGKLPELNPTAMRAETAFLMATVWGYEALGYPEGGRIIEGALADFQILNLSQSPSFWPEHKLLSALVYSADSSAVESVAVAGRLLIDHGEAKTFDLEKLRYEVQQSANYLCQK